MLNQEIMMSLMPGTFGAMVSDESTLQDYRDSEVISRISEVMMAGKDSASVSFVEYKRALDANILSVERRLAGFCSDPDLPTLTDEQKLSLASWPGEGDSVVYPVFLPEAEAERERAQLRAEHAAVEVDGYFQCMNGRSARYNAAST